MNETLYPRPANAAPRPFSDLVVDIVAIVGGVLVMASSIAAAAARWGTLSVTVRLLMLAAVQIAVTAASELLAKRIPTVGRVLIHLSAFLVLPTAIAPVAQLTGTWRACIAIGGAVAGTAVWAQGRRKQAPLLTGSTAIGGVISAAGLAAITGVPLAAIVGALAVGALCIGWTRRAALLSGISVAVPLAAISARLHIGPGTLHELGAVGPNVSLGALIGGSLAGAVLARIAAKHRSQPYAWASVAAFGTVALAVADLVDLSQFRVVVPGIVFIAAQLLVRFIERTGKVKPELQFGLLVDVCELVAVVPLMLVFVDESSTSLIGGALIGVAYALGAFRKRELPAALPTLCATLFGSVAIGVTFGFAWAVSSAAAISALMFWSLRERKWLSLSSAIVPLALLQHAGAMHGDRFVIATILGVLGLVCLGASAAVRPRLHPVSVMGISSLTLAATQLHGSAICLGLALAGLLIAGFGRLIHDRYVEFGGVAASMFGGFAFAATSGWSVDIRVAVIVCVLAIAEFGFRDVVNHPKLSVVPWFSPSITLGTLYLVGTLDHSSATRLGWTIAIAIVSISAGAIAQHKILLYTGIALSAVTMIVASADKLRALPVWVWAMAGGLGLLVLAATLELCRASRKAAALKSAESPSPTEEPVGPPPPPPQPFEPLNALVD
jgi:hypothetical protein